MSPAARHQPILPRWQLVLLLGVCAGGIWFLLPNDSKLVDNLIRDGAYDEARNVLEKFTPAERAQDPERYNFFDVRLARLELPVNDPLALDAFWGRAVTAWRETNFSGPIFLEFTPLIPQLRDPAAAWALVAPDIGRVPPGQRDRIVGDFVRATLAASQPVAAAQIFAAGHPPEGRAPAATLELTRLWQLAGRPADALAALGNDNAIELLPRRVELLRALNLNRDAFAVLRARAEAMPDRAPDAALAAEIAAVGLAADIPGEAALLVERYVAKNPRDLDATRLLRTLFMATGQIEPALDMARVAAALSEHRADDVRELARILEYSGRAAEAFDLWLELVLKQGDLVALDRLVALNPGLFRDLDLARALERVVPVPGRPELTLQLARVETLLGRYDQARKYFETYTAGSTDADALIEFAHLQRELYRFAEAEALFRRVAALRPGDISVRRELAETIVLQNRPADALAVYSELAGESDSEEILGPYIRLAESLGRYEDFTRGLRRRIDRAPDEAARDYLMLAYGYELANDQARREATLEEGRRRAPQNEALRLQFAVTLANEKKYQAAQASLADHPGLRSDVTVAMLYLDLMRLNNDTASERAYLATPLAPALATDETVLERVARAHEALNEFTAAERIWRELVAMRPTDLERSAALARVLLTRGRPVEASRVLAPFLQNPSPATLKLAAEIAESSGDHRTAEKYQIAYLDALRTAPATDWRALGDIRLARGDRTGAKRAYAEALRRLQARLPAKGTTP